MTHRLTARITTSDTSRWITAAITTFALAVLVAGFGLSRLPHPQKACAPLNDAQSTALHSAQHYLLTSVLVFLAAGITALCGLIAPRVSGTGRIVCGLLMLANGLSGLFALVIWGFYPGVC